MRRMLRESTTPVCSLISTSSSSLYVFTLAQPCVWAPALLQLQFPVGDSSEVQRMEQISRASVSDGSSVNQTTVSYFCQLQSVKSGISITVCLKQWLLVYWNRAARACCIFSSIVLRLLEDHGCLHQLLTVDN